MTTEAAKRKIESKADNADEPAAKRTKTDEEPAAAAEQQEATAEADAGVDQAGDAADVNTADDDAGAAADAADEDAAAAASREPVKLGYRTFKTGQEASDYFSHILQKSKPGERLNEYEVLLLLDLLQKGHPRASEKLSKGVKGFKVEETRVGSSSSTCFHIEALDGTLEDFSYRKCLSSLFSDYHMKEPSTRASGRRGPPGGDRRGGEGARGGRGGRGGRRGGRGRGRGRGGRH